MGADEDEHYVPAYGRSTSNYAKTFCGQAERGPFDDLFLLKLAVRRVRTLMVLCWISEDRDQSLRLSMARYNQVIHYHFLATLTVMVTHSLGGEILSFSTSINAITLKTHLSLAIHMSQQLEDEALVR